MISIITEKIEYFINKLIVINFRINPIKEGKPLIDNINKYAIMTNI